MRSPIELAPDQEQAIYHITQFLLNPEQREFVLGGFAGTGKTTLVNYLLHDMRNSKHVKILELVHGKDLEENDVHLTSTTHKAASVLSNATKRVVSTVHSFLCLNVRKDYATGETSLVKNPKAKAKGMPRLSDRALLIIDEASMINKELLTHIRHEMGDRKVLYIGDPYQLNPVKEGISPIFQGDIPRFDLTEIKRQAANSSIISYASLYRAAVDTGDLPAVQGDNRDVVQLAPHDFRVQMEKCFQDPDLATKSKVLAWTNNRVNAYNNHIKQLLTNTTDFYEGEVLLVSEAIWSANASIRANTLVRILGINETIYRDIESYQLEIDYPEFPEKIPARVYVPIRPSDLKKEISQARKAKDWDTMFDLQAAFADLRPYYASTVNKAQGSTYENVFIDLGDIGRNRNISDQARLVYTALTRASGKVYLRGES